VRFIAIAALSAAFLFTASPVSAERRFSHSVQAARAYALHAIGAAQFRCLDALFERESHWNPKAHNRQSGAHGIPQAVPGSKMGKGWESDPMVQVRWGLRYVKVRYHGACNALDHAYRTGWY
jgi:hypothetical protein